MSEQDNACGLESASTPVERAAKWWTASTRAEASKASTSLMQRRGSRRSGASPCRTVSVRRNIVFTPRNTPERDGTGKVCLHHSSPNTPALAKGYRESVGYGRSSAANSETSSSATWPSTKTSHRLCYMRGPAGIIVALAEETLLKRSPLSRNRWRPRRSLDSVPLLATILRRFLSCERMSAGRDHARPRTLPSIRSSATTNSRRC